MAIAMPFQNFDTPPGIVSIGGGQSLSDLARSLGFSNTTATQNQGDSIGTAAKPVGAVVTGPTFTPSAAATAAGFEPSGAGGPGNRSIDPQTAGQDFANANVAATPDLGSALKTASLFGSSPMGLGLGIVGDILGNATGINLPGGGVLDPQTSRLSPDEMATVKAAWDNAIAMGYTARHAMVFAQNALTQARSQFANRLGTVNAQTGGLPPGISNAVIAGPNVATPGGPTINRTGSSALDNAGNLADALATGPNVGSPGFGISRTGSVSLTGGGGTAPGAGSPGGGIGDNDTGALGGGLGGGVNGSGANRSQ